jgi:hypothetical protein
MGRTITSGSLETDSRVRLYRAGSVPFDSLLRFKKPSRQPSDSPWQRRFGRPIDPRGQAVIAVAEFIETNPQEVWTFARRWGCSPDDDLQAAIATCVLEHILERHFDVFIARV